MHCAQLTMAWRSREAEEEEGEDGRTASLAVWSVGGEEVRLERRWLVMAVLPVASVPCRTTLRHGIPSGCEEKR